MKAFKNIITTAVLSFMMVFLSAGIPIMDCSCKMCAPEARMSMESAIGNDKPSCPCCSARESENCKPENTSGKQDGNCSKVSIAKLGTTMVQNVQADANHSAFPLMLLAGILPMQAGAVQALPQDEETIYAKYLIRKPPRDELSMICVLQI